MRWAKKELVTKLLGHLQGGRVTWSEPSIDFQQRILLSFHLVKEQGLANGITGRDVIYIEDVKSRYVRSQDLFKDFFINHLIISGDYLSTLWVSQRVSQDLAFDIFKPNGYTFNLCLQKLFESLFRKTVPFFDDYLTSLWMFYRS